MDIIKKLLRDIDKQIDDIENMKEDQKAIADKLLKNLETIDKLMNNMED